MSESNIPPIGGLIMDGVRELILLLAAAGAILAAIVFGSALASFGASHSLVAFAVAYGSPLAALAAALWALASGRAKTRRAAV
jgi:lipopolysaccharide export LptBFGC system permease protein LptF